MGNQNKSSLQKQGGGEPDLNQNKSVLFLLSMVTEVKHTSPQPVTGLVFTGSIPTTPHKPVVSKTSEANIWLSSYDHLTDVGGQRGGCQQLLQQKGECFLLNKKEA